MEPEIHQEGRFLQQGLCVQSSLLPSVAFQLQLLVQSLSLSLNPIAVFSKEHKEFHLSDATFSKSFHERQKNDTVQERCDDAEWFLWIAANSQKLQYVLFV